MPHNDHQKARKKSDHSLKIFRMTEVLKYSILLIRKYQDSDQKSSA